MSCPTCGHTMSALNEHQFHCERCGTVVDQTDPKFYAVYVPKLVERCRDFEARNDASWLRSLWHTLGIAESIHVPEERPST